MIVAPTLVDFETRFDLFSLGVLRGLDWKGNGIIAAGGAVLACLEPLPQIVQRQYQWTSEQNDVRAMQAVLLSYFNGVEPNPEFNPAKEQEFTEFLRDLRHSSRTVNSDLFDSPAYEYVGFSRVGCYDSGRTKFSQEQRSLGERWNRANDYRETPGGLNGDRKYRYLHVPAHTPRWFYRGMHWDTKAHLRFPYDAFLYRGHRSDIVPDEEQPDKTLFAMGYRPRSPFRSSDIDLFLVGNDDGVPVTDEQGAAAIQAVYAAMRRNIPAWCDIVVYRSRFAVTLSPGWPYRTVQVILRAYRARSEVPLGFDLDAVSCIYQGPSGGGSSRGRVEVLPRCLRALRTRTNLADIGRMSLTFETRLWKYSVRGFAVAIPGFDMNRVDKAALIRKYSERNKSPGQTSQKKNFSPVEGLQRLLLMSLKFPLYSDSQRFLDASTRRSRAWGTSSSLTTPDPADDEEANADLVSGEKSLAEAYIQLEKSDYEDGLPLVPMYTPFWGFASAYGMDPASAFAWRSTTQDSLVGTKEAASTRLSKAAQRAERSMQ